MAIASADLRRGAPILAGALIAMAAHGAEASAYRVLRAGDFQGFVANWTSENRAFCAVISSAAQWSAVIRPAAVMGPHKPFAPSEGFWRDHAVLLIARVFPMGDASRAIRIEGVRKTRDRTEVVTRFTPPPPASASMKAWAGAVVAKPTPASVVFTDPAGATVCEAASSGS